jgi:hypothetical protein
MTIPVIQVKPHGDIDLPEVDPNQGLRDLYKELGQIHWLGSDYSWDLAIDAVRRRIEEMVGYPKP